MERIDKGLVILVGRDRENPRTHRDAFQITGGLGEMLDEHIKRNNLNKSEFIREAIAAKLEAEMPKEPLIKDEKIREIIRAWADVNDAGKLKYNSDENSLDDIYRNEITFNMGLGLEDGKEYIISELCGEEDSDEA